MKDKDIIGPKKFFMFMLSIIVALVVVGGLAWLVILFIKHAHIY